MDPNEVPTKGNLIRAKNSMVLARQGYDLMDKKRNILMRELMALTDQAKEIQTQIDQTYKAAYLDLQAANVELGISNVQMIAASIPVENSVKIHTRSIMGTEIPLVRYEKAADSKPPYAFYRTRDALDRARNSFEKVKEMTIRLSQVEISAYRLAADIQRTQKRANALQNITIPRYEALVKSISNALEEKEREEFTRLKVIKRQKAARAAKEKKAS